jgi:hypothetical protein
MSKKATAPEQTNQTEPRKIKAPKYRSFRLQKRLSKPETVKLSSSFQLFRRSLGVLKRNRKTFLYIVLIYAALNLLLVQGYFGIDVASMKDNLQNSITGNWSKVSGGLAILTSITGSSGSEASTSAYRFVLMVIVSLAVIWALRQVLAGKKMRARQAFYEGMYPLVPFVLVFLLISLQLVPLALSLYLYNVSGSTGGLEVILWGVVLVSLAALTLYWLSSSIFALYIACLPGARPIMALRSAVNLVRYRRTTHIVPACHTCVRISSSHAAGYLLAHASGSRGILCLPDGSPAGGPQLFVHRLQGTTP